MSLRGQISEGVTITLEPSGVRLFRGIERWAELVQDFSPAWPHVTTLIRRHFKRTFDSRGGRVGDGRKWQRLSPRYRARKAREFPGRPLLVRTSALRSAMVRGGSGSLVRKDKRSLTVGLQGRNRRIAEYHQSGTRNMPARPVVKFDPAIKNGTLPWTISQILQAQIVAYRKQALGVDDIFTDSAEAKRRGSMRRLARLRTR